MVALPVAPQCLRIRFTGKLNTQNIAHIMHAQYGGGTPSVADCTALATLFRNAFNTRFGPLVPNTVSYSQVEVADLGSVTGAVGINTTAITGTGSVSAITPNSACAVVSWKIGIRYRGGKPRTYFPIGSAASLVNGVGLPAAHVTSLKAAAAGFITDVNTFTSGTILVTFASVSYFHQGQLRPTGIPYPIVGSDVHNRVDSQRRRLGKEF